MKKILYLLLVAALLSTASCMKIDNWDAPDCTFEGTVYDSYTNQPLLASQNDWQIRIWERSFKGYEDGASNYQELRIKQDGTYRNTKLFAGTYDMYLYDGPFWPIDTIKNVELKSTTIQDFTVTPYMQVIDFKTELSGDQLTLKFKLKAPLLEKDGNRIPNLYDVRFWISFNNYCGNGSDSNIGFNEWHGLEYNGQKQLRQAWTDVIKPENGGNGIDTSCEYMLGPIKLKTGHKYYVRGGANVNTANRRYNYSEIKEIDLR